jgi:serine/threonine protein kinase
MISFFCSHCGLKFEVKPEFAGRSSQCPTCKQPLVVPQLDRTEDGVSAGQIEGSDSSLAKVGVDGGVTLDQTDARPDQRSVRELLSRQTQSDGRYVIEREIARGGMGMVLRAVDCDIRREVAVKYLLNQSDPGKKLRFIEEAQITGQLEHPNIVPIHELGVDNAKRLFFTMKMVKGRSLAQVLEELRQHPKQAEKEWSLGRLLHILVNVCHALAYAHSRGVVHRDLKPANIMLGDFGEVYVMDWGLARVLKDRPAPAAAPLATVVAGGPAAAPAALPVGENVSIKRSSKVDTSRLPDADLTQEGAVVGTPVYMPPEQASGHVDAIDQRSDIYSLGAILYEMLALQPPIDKSGGYLEILLRVMQGEIVPPEQRATNRTIPAELSAIAMKALAKNPQNRYASVEALRRDIERFQEGRSVSAKEDTYREAVWRLVKRNKLASGFTAALAVVLLWGSVVNFLARRDAEKANAETLRRTTKAVPALVHSARLLANDWQMDEARAQLDFARQYDAKYVQAQLVKGQMLIAQKDFAAGCTELEQYLQQQPEDEEAKKLFDLCSRGKSDDPAVLIAVAEVFQRQKMPGLTFRLLNDFRQSLADRKPLEALYQKQIAASWPGLGRRLRLERDGQFRLNLGFHKEVAALDPLRGMQLHWLSLEQCDRIADLSPLRDMPLTMLSLAGCALVSDLTPLEGMPLTSLQLTSCVRVQDLTPLRDLPLTSLNLHNCRQVSDLTPLRGLPLRSLTLADCGQVSDLTPLAGLPLTWLDLSHCENVRDLTPLHELPLTELSLDYCPQLKDLTPLHGMKLKSLHLMNCFQVEDLTPLEGLALTEIMLNPRANTRGMNALRQMKSLKTIAIGWEAKQKLSPAEFWRKYDAGEFK